jgi:hypothetical protein
MDNRVSIEELRKIIALRDLPDEHLKWILDNTDYMEYDDGDAIYKTGETIEQMAIILEGKINFYMNVSGRLVYYFCFENDTLSGGLSGLLPYSRIRHRPALPTLLGSSECLDFIKNISRNWKSLIRILYSALSDI